MSVNRASGISPARVAALQAKIAHDKRATAAGLVAGMAATVVPGGYVGFLAGGAMAQAGFGVTPTVLGGIGAALVTGAAVGFGVDEFAKHVL